MTAHTGERKTHPDRSPRQPGPLLHTTNPTTRTMATTMAIKEIQTVIRTSKQHIQSTINKTCCEMDAQGIRIPSKVNMAECNINRKLFWMANPHQTQRQQVLPKYGKNTKSSYESDAQECPI